MKRHNEKNIWSPLFAGIVLISMMSCVCSQGSNAAIPFYVEEMGRGTSLSGLLATAYAFAAALARIASGPLADSLGRRSAMLAGTAVFFLGSALPLLFSSLNLLLFFRVLQGAGFAVSTTAAAAAAADILPPARLGEGLGYYGLGQSLAMAFGPALALALTARSGAPALHALMSALMLLGFILSWFCRYSQDAARPRAARQPLLSLVFEPRALLPAGIELIYAFALALPMAFVALYAASKGITHTGLFFTMMAAAMIATRLTAGRLIDRFPPLPILLAAQSLAVLAFFLVLAATNLGLYCLAGLVFGANFGVVLPLLSSIAVRRSAKHRFGAANATFYLAVDVGVGLGSLFWGLVIDSYGYTAALLGGIAVMLLAALVGGRLLSREKSPSEAAERQTA